MRNKHGGIIVLAGPSGAGKSSLSVALFDEFDDIEFCVSCTTRMPRNAEVEGKHYYFISRDAFLEGIENGDFIEYAQVHGNLYGTRKSELEKIIHAGKFALLDIDVQGHANIKKLYQEHVLSIFITPPCLSLLKQRLEERCTEDKEYIENRLLNASQEICCIHQFDYLIINDEWQNAKRDLFAVVRAFFHRTQCYDIQSFIKFWTQG